MSRRMPALLLVATFTLAGCRSAMLYHPPPVGFRALPSAAIVEDAIFEGCGRRGWICTKTGSGLVHGTLRLRAHVVEVDIAYDAQSFEVKYAGSVNMQYHRSGDTETIHANYNSWIRYLVGDITSAIEHARAKSERP